MWRVDPAQTAVPDAELLAIAQRTHRPDGKVVQRGEDTDFGAEGGCLRRRREEFIEGSEFVAFKVGAAHPAEILHGHHLADGFQGDGKQLAVTGVEQQRLLSSDEVGTERESPGKDIHWRTDAIDAIGNFIHTSSGLLIRDHEWSPLIWLGDGLGWLMNRVDWQSAGGGPCGAGQVRQLLAVRGWPIDAGYFATHGA